MENAVNGQEEAAVGSREWLLQTQIETFNTITELTRRKNNDYAGKGGDAFNNFTRIEHFSKTTTTEQGFMVRLVDKFSRIGSFIDSGTLLVKDESVEDTLLDLANYSFLFYAYLKSKKLKQERSREVEAQQMKMSFKAYEYDRFIKDKEHLQVEGLKSECSSGKDYSLGDKKMFVPSEVEGDKEDTESIDFHLKVVKEQYPHIDHEAAQEMAFLRYSITRYQDNEIVLTNSNQSLLHSIKQMAQDLSRYKKIGTVSEVQESPNNTYDNSGV